MTAARATAEAPANIAFVKYWGARDLDHAVPWTASLSMTLRRCCSVCTVEVIELDEDLVQWVNRNGECVDPGVGFASRVRAHLATLRRRLGTAARFRVATRNNFPSSAGIASSASGFAALTMATVAVAGRRLDPAALSVLARMSGSGSAARSTLGGFVEWPEDISNPQGPAAQVATADHWPLCDVIAVTDQGEKAVPSRQGHRRAPTSPLFATRLSLVPERLEQARQAIRDRDLEGLGRVIESEALDLHYIAMSSQPPIYYWNGGTIDVLKTVQRLRKTGCPVFWTMDAGANVHLICSQAERETVVREVEALESVRQVIRDEVGPGPRLLDTHLI